MLIFWRQIQENVRNSQWVCGHCGRAFQKSELKFQALQQREHRPQNCRKHSHWRWYRVAILRAPGPMSSQMALQRMLLGRTSSLSIPAGDVSSNYRAEVHALKLQVKAATELLIEEDCNQQNIVLLSDSLSTLQSLTNGPTDLNTQQLYNSLHTLSDSNRVVLQWVPAHVGIAGNETADRLAKAAAKLPQPHFSTSYKEVKTLLKQKQKSAWRQKKQNNGYDPQKDQVNSLDRRTQTTIFCLRTGHCGLRKHLKKLGLADSAHCECGSEEQTPEHILQTCPHLETVCQQFWPEDTEVGTKRWGQAAELQRTADFLAATSLRN